MNTTYFKNLIMNHVFGRSATPNALPSRFYAGLSTTTPTANGDGVTEPASAVGYARVDVTDSLGGADGGVIRNTVSIDFPESAADWGGVTHMLLFDAETGGNLLAWSQLATSKTVEAETSVTVKPSNFVLTLS